MADYVIEMLNITKEFPGIKANDNVTLQLKRGEIHALLGENGAGKSTLMSVLFGLYQPESGVIKKDGQVVSRTLLCKSTYTPSTEVVRIGTKKRDAEGGIVENPKEPVPETPGISDVPTVSDAPVVSDVPVVSEPPVVPDVPAVPETPVGPETPAVPEVTAPEPVIMQ